MCYLVGCRARDSHLHLEGDKHTVIHLFGRAGRAAFCCQRHEDGRDVATSRADQTSALTELTSQRAGGDRQLGGGDAGVTAKRGAGPMEVEGAWLSPHGSGNTTHMCTHMQHTPQIYTGTHTHGCTHVRHTSARTRGCTHMGHTSTHTRGCTHV